MVFSNSLYYKFYEIVFNLLKHLILNLFYLKKFLNLPERHPCWCLWLIRDKYLCCYRHMHV